MQTNSHKFSVKYSQISDIIGEEKWVDREMNTLSNIGSHQIVNPLFGAKKKEKKSNTQSLLEDLSSHNKKAKKKGIEYSESNKSKDLLIVGGLCYSYEPWYEVDKLCQSYWHQCQ